MTLLTIVRLRLLPLPPATPCQHRSAADAYANAGFDIIRIFRHAMPPAAACHCAYAVLPAQLR
jgi:hypothetical protein